MRTGKLKLGDVEYPLCYSTAVMAKMEERGETTTEFLRRVDSGSVTAKITLLHDLMAAGKTLADMNGEESPEPLSIEALMNGTCVDDYEEIDRAIVETLLAGQTPTVEVAPPKKTKAAPQAK